VDKNKEERENEGEIFSQQWKEIKLNDKWRQTFDG
jgi:hypothetical protein